MTSAEREATTLRRSTRPRAVRSLPVFRSDRAVALGWLVMMATTPIQWMQLASSGLGVVRWFHVGASVFGAAALLSILVRGCLPRVLRTAGPFIAAVMVWVVMLAAARQRHGGGLSEDAAQQLAYAGVALVIAAWFARLLLDDDEGLWRWVLLTGVVTMVTFLVVFDSSARDAGVDALDTAVRGITTGQTSIIEFELFRRTFEAGSTGDTDARANVRHEVFAALVVAMWVTVLAWSRTDRLTTRPVMLCTVGLTLVLTFVSLSRSTYLMGALALVPLALRSVLNRWATRRETYLMVAGTWVLLAGALSGAYLVIANRLFGQQDSYTGRSAFVGETIADIADQFFVGHAGVPKAHNIVLDSWFRGGVATALPAIAMVVLIGVALLHFGGRVVRERQLDWADVALFGLAAVPMVRMFTAGGGTLHFTSWVAIGVVGGGWAVRNRSQPAPPRRGGGRPALRG